MNCESVERLLDAYLDGELDLVKSLELEEHLPTCDQCRNAYAGRQTLRRAFQSSDLVFRAPSRLEKRVRASIAKETRRNTRFISQPRLWLGAAAALIFVVWFAFSPGHLIRPLPGDDAIASEVLAGHVRSLMAHHLVDVASTSQHTVKPWFAGKLDFSPPVTDLADDGFPLVGGRLDYLDHRQVAALIYRHQKHLINLFIWPDDKDTQTTPLAVTEQGYHLTHWTEGEMTYWAASDMNENELRRFAQLLQRSNIRPNPPK